MSQPRTHSLLSTRSPRPRSPSPTVAALIVIGMLAMLVIPAALTLHSVRAPGKLEVIANASPHGYTWSLLLIHSSDHWR